MPIILCPDCNKQISDTLECCPHCGRKLSQEDVNEMKVYQKWSTIVKFVIGLILFVVLLKVCNTKDDGASNSPWQSEDASTMAYVMAKEWVKKNLKSPSTAEFPTMEMKNHTFKNGQIYTIKSYVDSQNSFGAMLRTNFTIVVKRIDKENWQLVSLEFDK